MDEEVKRVVLNGWLDSIEEILNKKHDELMDLEYTDETCAFYNEDDVWDIFGSCEHLLMHCVYRMRKELLDVKCDKKSQFTDLKFREFHYAQRDDELIRKELQDESGKM